MRSSSQSLECKCFSKRLFQSPGDRHAYKLKFFVDPIRYMRSINNPKKFIWKTCLYFPITAWADFPGPSKTCLNLAGLTRRKKRTKKRIIIIIIMCFRAHQFDLFTSELGLLGQPRGGHRKKFFFYRLKKYSVCFMFSYNSSLWSRRTGFQTNKRHVFAGRCRIF